MISGFYSDVAEICALLGYYAVYSGSPLPTFQDNISLPNLENGTDVLSRNFGNCHYKPCNVIEKGGSHGKLCS